jgi:hypothetical protein
MRARTSSDERDSLGILPIRVGDGEVRGIPFNVAVPDARERTVEAAAKLIIDRLRLIAPQTEVPMVPAGTIAQDTSDLARADFTPTKLQIKILQAIAHSLEGPWADPSADDIAKEIRGVRRFEIEGALEGLELQKFVSSASGLLFASRTYSLAPGGRAYLLKESERNQERE